MARDGRRRKASSGRVRTYKTSPEKVSQGGSSFPDAPTGTPLGVSIDPEAHLKARYPHGHPSFIEESLEEIKLHSDKNFRYAGGGGPFGNFNRVVGILDQYNMLSHLIPLNLLCVYMLKHVDSVLCGLSEGHQTDNQLRESFRDISVYAKIALCMLSEDKDYGE